MDILFQRLHNQGLLAARPATPADVVRWLGAIQAQDYGGARWAVAQRTPNLTAADVDNALADGSILRTHVLRPTWHLVTPADLRWMLMLTAPRVKALTAYGHRHSGVDDATIARSSRVVATALSGGRQLTRNELRSVLQQAGIVPRDSVALGHLMLAAELDGVVCSGAMRGKQHTYALFDDRVPSSPPMDRTAALAQLAARYHTSHGPATIKDFAWWSGLSIADATSGTNSTRPGLDSVDIDGRTFWFAAARPAILSASPTAHLLPNFDEYTVAYADRTDVIHAHDVRYLQPRPELIFNNVVVIDGRIAGTWRRTILKNVVRVSLSPFRALREQENAAVEAAAQRYAAVLQLSLRLEGHEPESASRSDARSMTKR